MPLVFKLVGCNSDGNFREIKKEIDGAVTLLNLRDMFMFYGVQKE